MSTNQTPTPNKPGQQGGQPTPGQQNQDPSRQGGQRDDKDNKDNPSGGKDQR